MTARTVHKWHVALLSALLVVSLASFGLTAGFIEYTKRVPIRIQVPGSRYNLGGIYTIYGIYFHANGLVVAAGVITFLTSLYFLIANTFSMYDERRTATSVELEVFFLIVGWVLSIVGAALFTSNIRWTSCNGDKFCSFATATMALGWVLFAVSTATLGLLIYHGCSSPKINGDNAWRESTLYRSSRQTEGNGVGRRRESGDTAVEPMRSRDDGIVGKVTV
ncbi:hypothetical protein FFLO_06300 [Filobasidium floriforme]|uniref:MARVEL domain-containing protein n=1 Tax=Filobasidium floriforme TaxID=5210 RepID=A0A8K0NN57_9TREE|nr:uncharacterized protein HD553DRAFT_311902 [Filobasidium floriforme]KAG7528268.1 hypothetical protein FFLO_06300 [Filobasidium floriforme]KAH8084022.1 hypothetical protein HD553DRAFT_311902 [Filobasidium floriforme]